jgi:hypothetical protein
LTESPGIPEAGVSDSSCLPDLEAAGMAMALSMDLRRRVLAAIGGGMSCRQAAAHFWGQRIECDPPSGAVAKIP